MASVQISWSHVSDVLHPHVSHVWVSQSSPHVSAGQVASGATVSSRGSSPRKTPSGSRPGPSAGASDGRTDKIGRAHV